MNLSVIIIEYFDLNLAVQNSKIIRELLTKDDEIILSSNSVYSKEFTNRNINNFEYFDSVIFNSKNGGFAYAINSAIDKSSNEILIILNSDAKPVVLDKKRIIRVFKDRHVGIIGPKIKDQNNEIQNSRRKFFSLKSVLSRLINPVDSHEYINSSEFYEVDWVIGCCMILRKNSLTHFDERYFSALFQYLGFLVMSRN